MRRLLLSAALALRLAPAAGAATPPPPAGPPSGLRADQHVLWNDVLGSGASFYLTNAVLRAHDRRAPTTARSPAMSLLAVPAQRGRGGELMVAWSW